MTDNVIKFAPLRAPPLELLLEDIELRLDCVGEDCHIQMTLYDPEHNIIDVLEFKLVSRPQHFILDMLCEAWARRVHSSGMAS